jgi:hypothetical protein
MVSNDPAGAARPIRSVFLSYASEDREVALVLRDALPDFGLEVWYDESALTGGDAWDQKIRRQIRECDFFMPLISANTEGRPEGYFRREWRFAVERTLDMADDHTFLLPVVIDATPEAGARVPEKFLTVQWLRVPGGRPTPALEALCRRLVAGETEAAAPKSTREKPKVRRTPSRTPDYPQFPRQEATGTASFALQVVGWTLQSAWTFFTRLPKWVQILVYLWAFVVLLAKCTPSDRHHANISRAGADTVAGIAHRREDA